MGKWKIISESIGLDILPFVLYRTLKDDSTTEKLKDIKEKINGLDKDKVEEAIAYSMEIYTSENSRCETIESKAQNLLGVTGISTGFVVGIASLLPETISTLAYWQIYSVIFLYTLIVISLISTVLSAFKVVKVGDYLFSMLEIDDVYLFPKQTILENKIEQLASIIYAYKHNYQISIRKATYLIGSQKWFRNAIILFLLLSFFLVFNIIGTIQNNKNLNVIVSPSIYTSTINVFNLTNTAKTTLPTSTSNLIPTHLQPQETVTPTKFIIISPYPKSITPTSGKSTP